MKLNTFELDHVNYWNVATCVIEDTIVDLVTLNYGSNDLLLYFKFPRFKAFCFYEAFLDYGETYTKSVEFMELNDQLIDQLPYLLNIYTIESEYMYG